MELHQARAYCKEKAALEGSDFYYASLYLDDATKACIFALETIMSELDTTVCNITDPGLARIKLNYWLEECARTVEHQSRHPALLCLQAHTELRDGLIRQLPELIQLQEARISVLHHQLSVDELQTFEHDCQSLWPLIFESINPELTHHASLAKLAPVVNRIKFRNRLIPHLQLKPECFRLLLTEAETAVATESVQSQLNQLQATIRSNIELMAGLIDELSLAQSAQMHFPLTIAKLLLQRMKKQSQCNTLQQLQKQHLLPISKLFISRYTKFTN